jgi:hypothetical protein
MTLPKLASSFQLSLNLPMIMQGECLGFVVVDDSISHELVSEFTSEAAAPISEVRDEVLSRNYITISRPQRPGNHSVTDRES